MSPKIKVLREKVNRRKVAVIGDAMLDVFIDGTTERVAREAPVPIVVVEREKFTPGGAANVAVNTATLGGRVDFYSVIGKDENGERLMKGLEEYGVGTKYLIMEEGKLTLAKKRIKAFEQTVVRFDYGKSEAISEAAETEMLSRLSDEVEAGRYEAVIVSDYGYGVLTERVIEKLAELSWKNNLIVTGDGKRLTRMKGVKFAVIKPNYVEACEVLGVRPLMRDRDRVVQMKREGKRLFEMIEAQVVVVSMDTAGALVFERGNGVYRTFAKPRRQNKSVGAGDTYISALTLALSTGTSVQSAAEFATNACEVVVQKEDTAPVYLEEMFDQDPFASKRIYDKRALRRLMRQYRRENKTIVFTNGCFDIIHKGHVTYLNQAKELGDVLVVGVNTDGTIRKLKGPERPINQLDDRLHVLAALSSVDYLVPFSERTPINLIRELRPDVFVKGGDYTRETLPETEVVEEFGGEVKILDYLEETSTTKIIERINERHLRGRKRLMNRTSGSGGWEHV